MSVILVSFTLVIATLVVFISKKNSRRLPPGPPAGLLGDHRAQVPNVEPWKTFLQWSREYRSPIITFYLGRTPNIVLNDIKSVYDLLEKRGEIYSSRPRNIMGQEILAGNMTGLGMEYGPRFRQWRKWQHAGMGEKAAHNYRIFQSQESAVLLRDLLVEPQGYSDHLKRFATSVAFNTSYGSRITSLKQQVVLENQRAQYAFGRTTIPGLYIVESWPILLRLPKFLQWFRWEQERMGAQDVELYSRLLTEVKCKMAEGRAKPCLSSIMLENAKKDEMTFVQMAYNAASSFAAGVSTVSASCHVFLLAMLHHPASLRKAQAEIDAVVGQSRMPTFEDEPSLPFLSALIKEVMRWRPVAPTGVAHAVTEDDQYDGFLIPKGSTVIANIYAISKDPQVFQDPEAFKPERFLNPETSHDSAFDSCFFGFGRRICPGQHVGLQSLFIVISRLLWAFDILPPLDAQGTAILPDPDAFVGGLVSQPKPFNIRLLARSSDVLPLIDASAAEAESELKMCD